MSKPRLPVLRTETGIVKSLEEWKGFAGRDDCLNRMVPSDLRLILSNLHEPSNNPDKILPCPNPWCPSNILENDMKEISDQYFLHAGPDIYTRTTKTSTSFKIFCSCGVGGNSEQSYCASAKEAVKQWNEAVG